MKQFLILVLLTFCIYQLVSTADFNHTECHELKTPKMRRSCCKLPHTDDVIKQCRHDILAGENSELMHKDKLQLKICIAECEFKAKGYLAGTSKLSMTIIEKDLLERHAEDKDYVDLLINSFHKCLDFAKEKTQAVSWLRSDKDCNLFPAALLACATEMVYEMCPEKKWHVTPECNKMREYLIKCDELARMEKNFHL